MLQKLMTVSNMVVCKLGHTSQWQCWCGIFLVIKHYATFCISGIIDDQEDSIFTYGENDDLFTYYFPDFEPTFEVTFNDSALEEAANEMCGSDPFCRFDIATTENTMIGLSTLIGNQEFEEVVNNSQPSEYPTINFIYLAKCLFITPSCGHFIVRASVSLTSTLKRKLMLVKSQSLYYSLVMS